MKEIAACLACIVIAPFAIVGTGLFLIGCLCRRVLLGGYYVDYPDVR